MALSWFRLDCNIGHHDKVLALLSQRGGPAAFASYVFAIGHCVSTENGGVISPLSLPLVHGTKATARLLVEHDLWQDLPLGGWAIKNFDKRQAPAGYSERRSQSSAKANCVRWHGPDCHCWKDVQ